MKQQFDLSVCVLYICFVSNFFCIVWHWWFPCLKFGFCYQEHVLIKKSLILKCVLFQVESVFTCTVGSLCDPVNLRQTQFRSKMKTTPKGYTMPAYQAGEFRIWGLTAIILHQVLGAIAPGLYKFRLRHRSWGLLISRILVFEVVEYLFFIYEGNDKQ